MAKPITFEQLEKHVLQRLVPRINNAAEEYKKQLVQEAIDSITESFEVAQRLAKQAQQPKASATPPSEPPKIIHQESKLLPAHRSDEEKLASFLASIAKP